ncbi:hypothetical protein Tco_0949987 [Tanacetum coccineum]
MEEPTGKSKRVKRPAKKSTQALARGVVIRETLEIPVSKKKEKVDVTRGKGIELLSDVALKEDAQFKEVRRKSMRDFHKSHPSGSGTATKPTPSVAIIKPSVTNEGTGVKPRVPDVTKEESSKSEAESWENDEDDSNTDQDSESEGSNQEKDSDDDKTQSNNEDESDSEHETDENKSGSKSDQEEDEEKIEDEEEEEEEEIVKTLSNDFDDEDEIKIVDKAEGDEDEEMDYTTSLLYGDVDIRLNELVILIKEDAHVTLSTVPHKTEVPVSSSSYSSNLAAKFLNFLDIPTTEDEIVSPLDVLVHHEVPSKKTPILLTIPVLVITDSSPVFSTVTPQSLQSFTPPPLLVTTLEQEVAELKKDPLHTQVTTLVDEHLDAKLGATRDEFMNFLSASLTARITKQVKDQFPQILPDVVSNVAPPEIERNVTKSLEHAVLAKESSQL